MKNRPITDHLQVSSRENLELLRLEESVSSELEGEITLKKCNAHLEEINHQVRRMDFLGNFITAFLIYWIRILLTVSTLRTELLKWHLHVGEA